MNILGIKRESIYSPNHIGNDEAIFNLTVQYLINQGFDIEVIDESDFLALDTVGQNVVFTMARKRDVLKKLQEMERAGKTVINSAFGIENCFRTNVTKCLIRNGIPHPKSAIVSTAQPKDTVFSGLGNNGYWLKRGDFHAIHKEDVTFVRDESEGIHIVNEFKLRGISEIVISENLTGDLVKFYGVRGTDFFFWFYPYDHNHHKYREYEEINGISMYYSFNELELRTVAERAATFVGIHIFGGDAIVQKDGNIKIIDFNDWPSFAPCRDDAAPFIGKRIMANIREQREVNIK